MLTLIKRIIAAAVVIAAVTAPTAAYARWVEEPGAPVPVSAPAPPAAPTAGHVAASASPGFQWDDAGVGAGALLVLVSLGAGTAVVYRRRTHRPLAG
jgi:hypothetical protein